MSDNEEPFDDLAASFSDEEREHIEDDLEGALRLRDRPQSLFVNAETSDMISPSGTIGDRDISDLERRHRESKERYRKEFEAKDEPTRDRRPPSAD